MVQFATQEWLDEYRERINASPVSREALAAWDGTVVYLFEAEEGLYPRSRAALMDFFRGECRAARLVEEADALVAQAPFLIRAPYTRWKQLVRGELDPVRALMQGLLRLKGDMRTIVRSLPASDKLFDLAAQIPTEFPDDQ